MENLSSKYKQLYKDIKYIEQTYGEIRDYCGAWCSCDILKQLLKSPDFKTAFEILISMLEVFYNSGYADGDTRCLLPIEEDKRLQKIKEKWL